MNDELLALYTADREKRVDQPRMGTPEYTAMRERGMQRRSAASAIDSRFWCRRRWHARRHGYRQCVACLNQPFVHHAVQPGQTPGHSDRLGSVWSRLVEQSRWSGGWSSVVPPIKVTVQVGILGIALYRPQPY